MTLEICWDENGGRNGVKTLARAFDEGWETLRKVEYLPCGHWVTTLTKDGGEDSVLMISFTG